jgi:hypothetical protein
MMPNIVELICRYGKIFSTVQFISKKLKRKYFFVLFGQIYTV